MKKRLVAILLLVFVLMITGCGNSNSEEEPIRADSQIMENPDQADTEETTSTEGVADYSAAIMVNDTIYLLEGVPMPAEIDESAIIGYTESFTDTFPENNGETNFNPELRMPYVQVDGGIAVLYENEWYLATPFSNVNNNVSSPIDGVTMEVTECSDTSVTVKIVNDTEKYIQCGDDFYLEVQDEESGEWRELDTVIDSYGFHETAHMIIKDSPYEIVIDFEWLYGKLEPGRYQIEKNVTDFRETGDHTSYAFTAEFIVN